MAKIKPGVKAIVTKFEKDTGKVIKNTVVGTRGKRNIIMKGDSVRKSLTGALSKEERKFNTIFSDAKNLYENIIKNGTKEQKARAVQPTTKKVREVLESLKDNSTIKEMKNFNDEIVKNRRDSIENYATARRVRNEVGGILDYKSSEQKAVRDFVKGDYSGSVAKEFERIKNIKVDKDEIDLIDKMGYYKVPQAAVGIGGTAFLVSRMCKSKGQMSNAELYGQSTPYSR